MIELDATFFKEISWYEDDGLRDYQAHHKRTIYKKWETIDSVLLQMPTGTGKTRLFVSMINDFNEYGLVHCCRLNTLIVTHRKELVEQIKHELYKNYGIKSTLITAENKESHKNPLAVCVASIQTLQRRLELHWKNYPFDFVIIDEAHHSKADTYERVLESFSSAKILGVTATPYRLNGEGFTKEYKELIVSPSVKKFIEAGWLSNYDYYSIKEDNDLYRGLDDIPLDKYGEYANSSLWNYIKKDRIRSEIVGSYLKYAKGKKAIVYTINKEHNKQLCDEFRECGVVACDIDSDTSPSKRRNLVERFRDGKIDVLCNVDIFTEGFDCPDVEVIQLARPTKSLGLYLQQVGRGLRIAQGKRKVIFLDNIGLHNSFGFPASRRMWRKHYLGVEIDSTSHYVSRDNEEPFELEARHHDFTEGCENLTLIESTGINEIIEAAKSEKLAGVNKTLSVVVKSILEANKKLFTILVENYSEEHLKYGGDFVEDLVTPLSSVVGDCDDYEFLSERIKKEFKPVVKNNSIAYEYYEDVEEYIECKEKMIYNRFMNELSDTRKFDFQEMERFNAENLYLFFKENFGADHRMTKKFDAFCRCIGNDTPWRAMLSQWNTFDPSKYAKKEDKEITNQESDADRKNTSVKIEIEDVPLKENPSSEKSQSSKDINNYRISNGPNYCTIKDTKGKEIYLSTGLIKRIGGHYYRIGYTYSCVAINLIEKNESGLFVTGKRIIFAHLRSELYSALNKQRIITQIKNLFYDNHKDMYYLQVDNRWYDSSGKLTRFGDVKPSVNKDVNSLKNATTYSISDRNKRGSSVTNSFSYSSKHHVARIGNWILWKPSGVIGKVVRFEYIGSLQKLVLQLKNGEEIKVFDIPKSYDIITK